MRVEMKQSPGEQDDVFRRPRCDATFFFGLFLARSDWLVQRGWLTFKILVSEGITTAMAMRVISILSALRRWLKESLESRVAG